MNWSNAPRYLRCVRRGELDRLIIPEKPLDVLAQQIVAATAGEDWDENEFFELARSAWPYRNLTREEFDSVVKMLAEGFSTKRGRRAALIHHDAVNHRLRGRRGARLVALTSGGAIPDNADYRVILEPSETFVGTVNEDFAVESLGGRHLSTRQCLVANSANQLRRRPRRRCERSAAGNSVLARRSSGAHVGVVAGRLRFADGNRNETR